MSRSEPTEGSGPTEGAEAGVDLRLLPAAAAAWLGMGIATAGGWAPILGGLVLALVVSAAAWWRRSWALAAVGLVLASTIGIGSVRDAALGSSPVRVLAEQKASVAIELTLTKDPQTFGEGSRAMVMAEGETLRIQGRGREYLVRQPVRISASGKQLGALSGVKVGAVFSVQARLGPPERGAPQAAWVRLQGPITEVSEPGPALLAVEHVRAGLRDAMAGRPAEQRGLVPALTVGDTSHMDATLATDFKTTGLTHLLAVSGANLSILLSFVLVLARWAGVRGRWLPVVGLATVAVFVALCRTEPSVLRASAMGLVALAAVGSGSRQKGMRHLCLAVLGLVLIDPWLSRSAGFALSVLASGGIIAWGATWRDKLACWMPTPLAEAISVPLSAQVGTQPVVTALSGEISVVGLLANALSGPFVGPATVLGFATAGLGVVLPPVARMTGWAAGWCVQGIITIAHFGARLPGASVRWPVSPAGLVIVTLLCLLLAVVLSGVLKRRWLVLALCAAMALALLRAPSGAGWPPARWEAVFCDVGQGDATVLNAGHGRAVVIDAGPDPRLLRTCLSSLGVREVPLLIITHAHADHVGGLSAVLCALPVGRVLTTPYSRHPGTVPGNRCHVQVDTAQLGASIHVGAVTWQTLGPSRAPRQLASTGEDSAEENDAGLVGLATVNGVTVLVTGDLEPDGQAQVRRTFGAVEADVLKVPHHGSGKQDAEFLTRTKAEVAVVSVGEKNDYRHPAPKTMQLLVGSGMTVVRTDTQGSIAVSRGQQGLVVTSQR